DERRLQINSAQPGRVRRLAGPTSWCGPFDAADLRPAEIAGGLGSPAHGSMAIRGLQSQSGLARSGSLGVFAKPERVARGAPPFGGAFRTICRRIAGIWLRHRHGVQHEGAGAAMADGGLLLPDVFDSGRYRSRSLLARFASAFPVGRQVRAVLIRDMTSPSSPTQSTQESAPAVDGALLALRAGLGVFFVLLL